MHAVLSTYSHQLFTALEVSFSLVVENKNWKLKCKPVCKFSEFSCRLILWLLNPASQGHWFQLRLLIDRILSRAINLQNLSGFHYIFQVYYPLFSSLNGEAKKIPRSGYWKGSFDERK